MARAPAAGAKAAGEPAAAVEVARARERREVGGLLLEYHSAELPAGPGGRRALPAVGPSRPAGPVEGGGKDDAAALDLYEEAIRAEPAAVLALCGCGAPSAELTIPAMLSL